MSPLKNVLNTFNFLKISGKSQGKANIKSTTQKGGKKNKIKCGGGGCLLKWSWSHLLLEVKFESSLGEGQGWQNIPDMGKEMSN